MLGILLMLSAAAAPVATPASRCAPTRLAACRDTNQLVASPAFTTAVRRFIGNRKASYLYKDGDVAAQQIEVLGGPPEEPTRIGALYRFTACRAHSCPEKGAAVLDTAGRIVALAILYSLCATADTRDCNRRDDLIVFMRERERLQRVEVVANLRACAPARLGGGAGCGKLYAAGPAEAAVWGRDGDRSGGCGRGPADRKPDALNLAKSRTIPRPTRHPSKSWDLPVRVAAPANGDTPAFAGVTEPVGVAKQCG